MIRKFGVIIFLLLLTNNYVIGAQLPDSTTLSKMIGIVKNTESGKGIEDIVNFDDLFDTNGNLRASIKEEISRIYFKENACYKIYLDYAIDSTVAVQKYKTMYYQLVSEFQKLSYQHIEVIDCKEQWQPYLTLYLKTYKIAYNQAPPPNCILILIDVRAFKNNKCEPSEEYRIRH